MPIEFNENELYRNYENILRTCIRDGYLIPYLIKNQTIPSQYDVSSQEVMRLYDKLNTYKHNKLTKMFRQRRTLELSILKGENEDYNNIHEYHINEINEFINNYPQFKNILS